MSDGMLAYVETVQSKEREIRCDVYTHQKWCAPSFTTDIGDMCIFPTFCCAGAEQITSIGFCPRLHPGHRAPPPGERILPNAHSKQNVVVPLSNIPNASSLCPKNPVLSHSRDPKLRARDIQCARRQVSAEICQHCRLVCSTRQCIYPSSLHAQSGAL